MLSEVESSGGRAARTAVLRTWYVIAEASSEFQPLLVSFRRTWWICSLRPTSSALVQGST